MKNSIKTIKLTRAVAGLDRTYSENDFEKIVDTVGALPPGKIVYRGGYFAFNILGEDIPELIGMYQHYMLDGPLQKRRMTRKLVLRCHLEDAAYRYKNNKKEKTKTPSHHKKDLVKLEKACDILIQEISHQNWQTSLYIFETPPCFWQDAERMLDLMRTEIQRRKESYSKQTIPREHRHQKDVALRNLIASFCDAWEYIMEKRVSTGSVSSDGKSGGPLIRFIQSALDPLGIEKTPHAIRKVLRDVGPNQKKLKF